MNGLAEIAVPIPLRRTFTYSIPSELAEAVGPGVQVEVPFGHKTSPGFVLRLTDRTEIAPDKLKAIRKVTYPERVFDQSILELALWVADYYVASIGEVLMTALPGGLRSTPRRARPMPKRERLGLAQVPKRLTAEQTAVVKAITAAIRKRNFGTFLLHGVTGSGKTEVYVRAAAHAIRQGGQALVLVPEIGLSYQVVERFRLAFGDRVGVLHSGMTKGSRQDTWRAARQGSLSVVVGARSAVFTPLPSLRLLVIDEENDAAYKQSDSPRYHAREVGIMRARMASATVVLGTATPALESYANARRGKYSLLSLPRRIDNRPRAKVRIEDLREETDGAARRTSVFSATLAASLADRIAKREQIILFLNRRGHSPYVQCRHCGYIAKCSDCDVTLTYHRDREALVCHYCGLTKDNVQECEKCGMIRFFFGGIGTQKVEEELRAVLPRARVLRFDFDSTRRAGSHSRILGAFARGEADILLGTQMVAKGLDFPRVTLVGVIHADGGLNMPDFRSAERTFQLLTQVAGRAGRGKKPGEVLLQTYYPEHYALTTAARQDYEAFFQEEMTSRRGLRYPPFSRMVNLLFDGRHEDLVIRSAEWVASVLRAVEGAESVRFLGPAPQPLSRLKGKHRWHLALCAARHAALVSLCEKALGSWEKREKMLSRVRLSIDVDPIDLL